MLIQATVPNTYAATKASLATWRPRTLQTLQLHPIVEGPELGPSNSLFCECGQRRAKAFKSCIDCRALEAKRDVSALDDEILAVLTEDGLLITEIVEQFSFKYKRYVIYETLKRLLQLGRVTRALERKVDGWLYMRAA